MNDLGKPARLTSICPTAQPLCFSLVSVPLWWGLLIFFRFRIPSRQHSNAIRGGLLSSPREPARGTPGHTRAPG